MQNRKHPNVSLLLDNVEEYRLIWNVIDLQRCFPTKFVRWMGVPRGYIHTYLKLLLPHLNGRLIALQINNWILELLSASFIENILWVTYVLSLACLHFEDSLWDHNVICTPYLTNFIFNAIAIHHWWNRGFWSSVFPTLSKTPQKRSNLFALVLLTFSQFLQQNPYLDIWDWLFKKLVTLSFLAQGMN